MAFAAFFAERYAWAVRGAYLLTYSQAAAEDIAQDAFRQMLERWAEIRHPSSYLWQAVTTGARAWGRRERRPLPASVATPLTVEHDGDVLVVRAVLAGLPRAQREALVLRHYLGLRDREIAEVMGCPVGTVKSHLYRGLRAMKEELS